MKSSNSGKFMFKDSFFKSRLSLSDQLAKKEEHNDANKIIAAQAKMNDKEMLDEDSIMLIESSSEIQSESSNPESISTQRCETPRNILTDEQ